MLPGVAIDGGPTSVLWKSVASAQGTLAVLGMVGTPDAVTVLCAFWCLKDRPRQERVVSGVSIMKDKVVLDATDQEMIVYYQSSQTIAKELDVHTKKMYYPL